MLQDSWLLNPENDATGSNKNASVQLFIVVDKAIFLEFDGSIINYAKGLLLLLAMYYCFNLQCDSKEEQLYQLLGEFVLVKPLWQSFILFIFHLINLPRKAGYSTIEH